MKDLPHFRTMSSAFLMLLHVMHIPWELGSCVVAEQV